MGTYNNSDFLKRRGSAAAAKKASLQKFLAAAEDPKLAQHQAKRSAINEARLIRKAEREVALLKRETELAEELAAAAERDALAKLKAEKMAALLALQNAQRETEIIAEKKAERDARYAARKAAKKVRRRGY